MTHGCQHGGEQQILWTGSCRFSVVYEAVKPPGRYTPSGPYSHKYLLERISIFNDKEGGIMYLNALKVKTF